MKTQFFCFWSLLIWLLQVPHISRIKLYLSLKVCDCPQQSLERGTNWSNSWIPHVEATGPGTGDRRVLVRSLAYPQSLPCYCLLQDQRAPSSFLSLPPSWEIPWPSAFSHNALSVTAQDLRKYVEESFCFSVLPSGVELSLPQSLPQICCLKTAHDSFNHSSSQQTFIP